jgi:MATE family multidrug resistance protein
VKDGGPIALGILAQAWPVLLGQFASVAYGVIDTVMTGHASPADLAAMGLGASAYASVFMISLLLVAGYLTVLGQGSSVGGGAGR